MPYPVAAARGKISLPLPLLASLVVYYSLEEASGTRVDSRGNYDLTDSNGVTSATGKVGDAASFAAVSSQNLYRNIAPLLSPGDSDFTMSCWVRSPAWTSPAGPLLTKRSNTSDEYEYALYEYDVPSGFPRFNWFISGDGGLGSFVNLEAPINLAINTWYFVIVDYSAAADIASIQVNGGTVYAASFAGGAFVGGWPFRIGAGEPASFHNGLVDEAAYYNRLLTTAERSFLYNGGSGRSYAEIAAYTG